MKQRKRQSEKPERSSLEDRIRGFDESNLRCARFILANRSKYETPTSGGLILWAEKVMERLG